MVGFDIDLLKYISKELGVDVKFQQVTSKTRIPLVAGGQITYNPNEDEFSGVVSLDVIRTCFFLAELNNIDILAAYVVNYYLHGYTKEEVYMLADPDFGELEVWI